PDGGSGGGGGALPNGRTGEIRRGDDFRCPFLLSPVDRTLERYFADVEGDWRRAFVLELRSGATGGGGGTWLGLCSVLADGKRDSFSSLAAGGSGVRSSPAAPSAPSVALIVSRNAESIVNELYMSVRNGFEASLN